MTGGYTGKILRVNLTTKTVSTIDTAKYEEYGGGLGMGTAIFWDLAVAPGDWDLQDAFDPRNVCCVMPGPMAGSGVPGVSRTAVMGLSPEAYPINWYHRTNFGGAFATMLKIAGWDGVVLEGKAANPVWINIINDKVTIEDAKALWGLDTWATQLKIYEAVLGVRDRFGTEWYKYGDSATNLKPAVVCCGPAGEKLSRIASLQHGTASGGGEGGFGGVFGSKNLKAISAIGSGSIKVADAKALIDTRLWFNQTFPMVDPAAATVTGSAACMGCDRNCRTRKGAYGGEAQCMDTMWFKSTTANDNLRASEIVNKLGINAFCTAFGGAMAIDVPGAPADFKKLVPDAPGVGWYVKYLYDKGVLGPGKQIDSAPLPMDQYGTLAFPTALGNAIATRTGIGDVLAEGLPRALKKWGRLESDAEAGMVRFPAWGFVFHWTLPGVEWAYGNLIGAGDIVHHDISNRIGPGRTPNPWTIDDAIKILQAKTIPYTGDPLMFNYQWKGEAAKTEGIYSMHNAKLVAWHRHYCTYWKESMVWCDSMTIEGLFNKKTPGYAGYLSLMEPRFYNAVTGKNATFADGIEAGRKIWNIKRAIRVLQGRQRDTEVFFPFMYKPGASYSAEQGGLPVYEAGKWGYQTLTDLYLDKAGVELWKDNFYTLEGWDLKNGWPTRKTLEGQGMKNVADTLEKKGKLGTA
jgi:aldehyde:ferredoxin oxidoreductase